MMHGLIVAILIAWGMAGPFAALPSDTVVVKADGGIVYDWPPVRSLYLLSTPLGEIDAWMEREAWRAASVHKWGRHDLAGECPERDRWCICSNGRRGPYPVDRMLSPTQWRLLFERVEEEAERAADLVYVRSLLDRLVLSRGSQEPAQTPDLTPLLLAAIDGAARGDRWMQADGVRRRSEGNPGILNREVIRARLSAAMGLATTSEQAIALASLAWSLGMEDEAQETLIFERTNAPVRIDQTQSAPKLVAP